MTALHLAVDAMLRTLRDRAPKPIVITNLGPPRPSWMGSPGIIGLTATTETRVIHDDIGQRDAGRHALAAALLELANTAAPGTRYELRAIAYELTARCPDCGRHLKRDPWRHCATCEPTTTPGVSS